MKCKLEFKRLVEALEDYAKWFAYIERMYHECDVHGIEESCDRAARLLEGVRRIYEELDESIAKLAECLGSG